MDKETIRKELNTLTEGNSLSYYTMSSILKDCNICEVLSKEDLCTYLEELEPLDILKIGNDFPNFMVDCKYFMVYINRSIIERVLHSFRDLDELVKYFNQQADKIVEYLHRSKEDLFPIIFFSK